MATNIPGPLKTADIQRFAVRAAQVEKAKPAAAYWCYYYVLDKVLSKGLHKTDEECQAYVVALMDKVEQMKADHVDDDAMRDDIAGKAYVEQFGLETFMRADNAIRANKASKQTADTFQASFTFLDVLQIWPPLDPEIVSKIKFAKYHAVRIAKAIKAGEDPNLTNPPPEDPTDPEALSAAGPPLDALDPEVRAIAGVGPVSPAESSSIPNFTDRPPSTTAAPFPPSIPPNPQSPVPTPFSHDQISSAQPIPPVVPSAESYYQDVNVSSTSHHDVSPLQASEAGGGYFPPVPPPPGTGPGIEGGGAGGPVSNVHSPPPVSMPPNPADASSPMHTGAAHPPFTQSPSHATSQYAPVPRSFGNVASQPQQQPPPQQQHYQQQQQQQYAPIGEVNDEAIARAQKHAKFAISALNFEDVATAVKELRLALADLGQR